MKSGRVSLAVAFVPMLLAACAGPLAQEGFEQAASLASDKLGTKPVWIRNDEDAKAVQSAIQERLARVLSADDAVALALLGNRELQAAYADLGIGAADLAEASRPPNPGFSFKRMSRTGELTIERQATIDILGLITLPVVHGIEERLFEQAKLRATGRMLRVAADTRRAYFDAVAAGQIVQYVTQVRDAAEAQVELARRMHAVGNFPLLDYAREQVFYAEAAARLARAKLAAASARERLARLTGAYGDALAFKLPDRLPELPGQVEAADGIEAKAIAERLDLRRGRAEVEALARSFGLTQATRFVNVLEIGYLRERETGKPLATGYEIGFEVPIFDFGESKVARAEHIYMQAVNRLAAGAINARSEVRETYMSYRAAHDLARHYREQILPVRKRISEEMLLRYNGMLVSVFDLLADSRDQIGTVVAAIEAERAFWLAETDLRFVTLADTGSSPRTSVSAEDGRRGAAAH